MRSQSYKPTAGWQDLLTSETSFNMTQSFRRDDVISKSGSKQQVLKIAHQ